MDIVRRKAITLCVVIAMLVACATTPVPVPPTVEVTPELISATYGDEEMLKLFIEGAPGAIEPPNVLLRIISVDGDDSTTDPFIEFNPNADGSFNQTVPGQAGLSHYLEVIDEDDDWFLMAFTAGPNDTIVEVEPGNDGDGDGSPDAIDCAPENDQYRGQRCP
jgi:hypothetical protein